MPETAGFDFDRTVQRAWDTFQGRLADHVAAMGDYDGLVLEPGFDHSSGDDGSRPCVQFYAWDNDQVRCEVPSNFHLHPHHLLSAGDETLLTELGWNAPTRSPADEEDTGSPAFWVDKPRSWADQLAVMTVTVLRRIWGVPDPTFLRTETFGNAATPEFTPRAETTQTDTTPKTDLPVAVDPLGDEHLRELIDLTLTQRLGHLPEKDEDGDVPLSIGKVVLFVGPKQGAPMVDLYAPLVRNITGRTRAAEILVDLNNRWAHVKLILIEDRVSAVVHLPTSPFVPQHLLDALDHLAAFLGTVDEHFADRLGGELYFTGHVCEADDGIGETEVDLPLALLALRDFHLAGVVEISADTVANICDRNRETILDYLRICSEQKNTCRTAAATLRGAGEVRAAEAADTKTREWELTIDSLRAALCLVVPARPPHSGATPTRSTQMELFEKPEERTLFDDPAD